MDNIKGKQAIDGMHDRARSVYDKLKGQEGGRGSDRCLLVAFAWDLVADWIVRASLATLGATTLKPPQESMI